MTPIVYKVQCTLCNRDFDTPDIEPVQPGVAPSPRAIRIIDGLTKHLQASHNSKLVIGGPPTSMELLLMAAQEFLSWLVLRNFKLQDPNLIARREQLRRDVHNLTRRVTVSDQAIADKIQKTVAGVGKGKITREIAFGLMVDLRDALTEQGRYAADAAAAAAPDETAGE